MNRRTDQPIKSRKLENRPSNQKPWIGEQTKQSKSVNRRTDQAIKSHESENIPTNQKPWIGEQTKQWQEGIKTNNLLENTKQKTWATRTTLKTGGEFGWFGRISSSCYTSGTHRVTLMKNPVISNKGEKCDAVLTTREPINWTILRKLQILEPTTANHGWHWLVLFQSINRSHLQD